MSETPTRRRLTNETEEPITINPGETIDVKAVERSKRGCAGRLTRIQVREVERK